MSEMYRRRIRVEGGMKDVSGYQLTVQDVDTGEKILNVTSIDLHLSAVGLNTATVTSYEHDETGKLVVKDDRPVIHTSETANPEVAITALETMTELEQLRAEVQMYRDATIGRIHRKREKELILDRMRNDVAHAFGEVSMCWKETPTGEFDDEKATQILDKLMNSLKAWLQE